MPNEQPMVLIDLTPEYKQNLRDLSKRFRNIRSDLQGIIEQLQQGSVLGDRIGGLGEEYVVYKARVRNSNIQRGKSAGYRLIYQVESPTSILLLTIYSKSDREDISVNEIRDIVTDFSS
ncbi:MULTISPECIES: type II toxin-antitoxin system RelE family toxin [Cyanophyceae]|uniref:Addiction module antitoxin n=1 Tax=Nodularia spumigena CENA596 TaxID=1819295 RepID=A0A166JFP8_NODSP|nr:MULTISPECIES: type II toxin-antitoxin system RelE/ParE family toxin [Cyanophyceae]MDB9358249.1 type II toxin-antitoxin system RelE/ParE family toxin [Nodularia spumigena CS-587/03]KZL49647.1 addiction module antitoxin [Nodularia spumigena CENA596]MDB9305811.1 type II toxin-antitoxin system RelE/ParE family toxin [Nodularia spumigena CS-591/12]MDB9320075.1 type II toxin-antitoxin system RelE/ParE family toxin [Nodularia spumigena CS-590/01A]MDB9323915.1 type II toxin-antitoxin system RelE/Pa